MHIANRKPGTALADGTAPLKTHSKNGWKRREVGGREACSVHAESDLTRSLPDGKASLSLLAGAGDISTLKNHTQDYAVVDTQHKIITGCEV